MRHTIHSDKWFVPTGYTGIDYETWAARNADGTGPAQYFVSDFSEPPLLPDAERVAFLIGQLTHAQYEQQYHLAIARPDVAPLYNQEWIKYLIRAGVRDVAGLEIEHQDGRVEPLKLTFEETSAGRMMSEQSYRALLPFGEHMMQQTASAIYHLSGRR